MNAWAKKFFDRSADLLGNLWARWQDEKEYENIADYLAPLQPIADECGVTLDRMSAKPFGVILNAGGETYLMTCNSRAVSIGQYVGYKLRTKLYTRDGGAQ